MPGGDKSGPTGMGAFTGRGFGYCTGAATVTNYGAGFGGVPRLGLGHRRGFGRGRVISGSIDQDIAEMPKKLLQNQKDLLKRRLDAIDKRLEEM